MQWSTDDPRAAKCCLNLVEPPPLFCIPQKLHGHPGARMSPCFHTTSLGLPDIVYLHKCQHKQNNDINKMHVTKWLIHCETWVPLRPHRPGSWPSPDKWVRPIRRSADLFVGPIDLVGSLHDFVKAFHKIPRQPNPARPQDLAYKTRHRWIPTKQIDRIWQEM
jgi:hypothetical protein